MAGFLSSICLFLNEYVFNCYCEYAIVVLNMQLCQTTKLRSFDKRSRLNLMCCLTLLTCLSHTRFILSSLSGSEKRGVMIKYREFQAIFDCNAYKSLMWYLYSKRIFKVYVKPCLKRRCVGVSRSGILRKRQNHGVVYILLAFYGITCCGVRQREMRRGCEMSRQ